MEKMEGVSLELKKATEELTAIYKKYDISGVVFLADGLGHGEFKLMIDQPSWALVEFISVNDQIALKFKIRGKTEEALQKTNRTINSFATISGMLEKIFEGFTAIYAQLKTRVTIEESDPGKIISHAEFMKNRRLDPSYEDIEKSLESLPMTWYPALLIGMIQSCRKSGAWKKDNINIFVKKIEDKLNAPTGNPDDH